MSTRGHNSRYGYPLADHARVVLKPRKDQEQTGHT